MDTKWKNMVKAIKKFIKEYYDCVFGFLLFIIGSFLFFVMLVNRYYFSTWDVWRICLIGNILVQPGICLLVRRYMKLRYRNWSQKGSAETYFAGYKKPCIYYQTWKAKKEKRSEKRFRRGAYEYFRICRKQFPIWKRIRCCSSISILWERRIPE